MTIRTDEQSTRSDARGQSQAFGPSVAPSTLRRSAEAILSPDLHPALGSDPAGRRSFRRAWPIVVVDLVSLVGSLVLALLVLAVISHVSGNSLNRFWRNVVQDIDFPFVALAMLGVYGLYRQRYRRMRHGSFGDLGSLVNAMAVGGIITLGISALQHRLTGSAEISPAPLFTMALCAVATVPAGRALWWWLRTGRSRDGKRRGSRVLVVGSGMMVERIRNYFADDSGIELVGSVDDNPVPGSSSIGSIADVSRLCVELDIDRVLIGFSQTHPSETLEQLRNLQGSVAISIVPRYFELLSWRSQVDDICGLPVIDVAPAQLSPAAGFIKRALDVVGALVGLLLLAPVAVIIAVGVKLSSPGPLLFRQQRVGRDGRGFTMYKFRTMKVGAESERDSLTVFNEVDGPTFKMRRDPRIFPFGGFLRRTSLDEIPQLYNVLRGDMALVGPRPFIASESEHIHGWAARRFEVRPGLTGLWQISGRNHLSFDELRQLDYLYVASWSMWWDLRILWHTPASVLRSRGAY